MKPEPPRNPSFAKLNSQHILRHFIVQTFQSSSLVAQQTIKTYQGTTMTTNQRSKRLKATPAKLHYPLEQELVPSETGTPFLPRAYSNFSCRNGLSTQQY